MIKKILLFVQFTIVVALLLLLVLMGLSDQQRFHMLSYQFMLGMLNILLTLEFCLLLIVAYLSDKVPNVWSQYMARKSWHYVFLWTGIVGVLCLFKPKN
ncbi:hypothetical protein [Leuconostoc rapi]|uniref:hypothetical protein n=1 Tax=Leuconostoc rapi TaxID=1406906 RepID=UPI0019579313|nr:hypothetical protein [Leuconostoc rapi]MBM7436597.1 hypothetical protein [Leuconostoc rapi]